ncbi:MAG TPA: hypothetical protein PKJ26_04410 [Candidatus Woesebacteria bacterium]|nr:hypothetical protein [Candidatus Woesebacteria bacterium]HNS65711.1 hypothetical protein [Candidatus Woesebacteria bacterium]
MSERVTIPPNFVDHIMGGDICPELLLLMLSIQRDFDEQQVTLERRLLNLSACECDRCWDLYWARWNELRSRDDNLQDLQEDESVLEDIHRYAPKLEEVD